MKKTGCSLVIDLGNCLTAGSRPAIGLREGLNRSGQFEGVMRPKEAEAQSDEDEGKRVTRREARNGCWEREAPGSATMRRLRV